MKKRIVAVIMLVCMVFLTSCKGKTVELTGNVSFTVVDGLNSTPIEGVKIVLPEDKVTLMSDSDGKTEECSVKVLCDDRYSVKQEYGTFTVLAFKEGYCDYALFYAQIRPDEHRKMKIFLFMQDTPIANGSPIAIIESPDEKWTEEYIGKYK